MLTESTLQDTSTPPELDRFQRLVREHERLVFSVCRRILPAADVDDAVQEVFVKLSTRLGQVRGNAVAWLHTCAVNTCRDVLRRNQARHRRESVYAEELHVKEAVASSIEESQKRAMLADVDAAMTELSDDERYLLIEYYLQGRTQEEIATHLRLNQSTIKRRLDRAVDNLRGRLLRHGMGAGLIAGLLTESVAAAEVPSTLSTKLLELHSTASLAPKLVVDQAVGSVAKLSTKVLVASLVFTLALSTLAVMWLNLLPSASTTQPTNAQNTSTSTLASDLTRVDYQVVTLESKTVYRKRFAVDPGFNFDDAVQEVLDEIAENGLTPVGPLTFLHPEGLFPEDETELIISFEIETDNGIAQLRSSEIEVLPRFRCVTWRPGNTNPRDAIILLDQEIARNGDLRTMNDRFEWTGYGLDPPDGYEVQMGIE